MKTNLLSKFLLVNVLLLTCANVMSEEDEVWTVASLNWEPYAGASMVGHGNSVTALAEKLKTKNIRLIVKFYPWKRAIEMARSKEFVGYFPSWAEDVLEGFVSSPLIEWSSIAIIQSSDEKLNFSSIDQLFERYKVGIIRDYTYPAEIEAAMKKYPHNVENTGYELSLLKMLVADRTDVVISDPLVLDYLSAKHGVGDNINVVKMITKKELVLALRDDEDNLEKIKLMKELFEEEPAQAE